MSETVIVKKKGDWKEVLDDCRFTVSKNTIDKEPSDNFKKEIMISEHSPIRDISYKWQWNGIPHWEGVHWVRHKWEKFVQSQREDYTGISRHELPQDVEQNMRGEANIQALIDTMRKRLCYRASNETRADAENLKIEISKDDEIIGNAFVPNCVYRCGCPEGKRGCNWFNMFVTDFPYESKNIFDIQDRYDFYNELFKLKRL